MAGAGKRHRVKELAHPGEARPSILFVQATEAAAYPPVINAAMLLAEGGWQVTVLTAPIANHRLAFAEHPRIEVRAVPPRPTHVMSKLNYLRYIGHAVWLARNLRPDAVYASDPLGGGAGLVAAKAAGARLIYHEHDSPGRQAAVSMLGRIRTAAARHADLVIFPNEQRAQIAAAEIGFPPEKLHVIWNMPLRSEMPAPATLSDDPLVLYYHGGITPARLPSQIVEAVRRFDGAVTLNIAGFEMPSSEGYIEQLIRFGTTEAGKPLVRYLGVKPLHSDLLAEAAQAHVGLALMPMITDDINMRHMTGASNKIFDYMAAGLATLVSDLPDWHAAYAVPGFARACDPTCVDSIAAALTWFRDNPQERHAMAARNRAKFETEWNYDTAFAPVIRTLQHWTAAGACV